MIRFIVVFLVCLLVLFTAELLQPVQAHVIMPFTAGVAHVSAWIMLLFDHNVIARGNDILSARSGGGIEIVAGCNGVEAVLILVSAILAFPSPWKHKLAGMAIGFLAIQSLNVVRIISLFYLREWNMVVRLVPFVSVAGADHSRCAGVLADLAALAAAHIADRHGLIHSGGCLAANFQGV